ncbi:Ankyrin repeat domain-containing protein 16 [Armadillidium vulgare]|nr:Ankyrin repeat domain-containing protein 16 [Armadillidium vulgare]
MGVPFWGSGPPGWIPEPSGGSNADCAHLDMYDQYHFHDEDCTRLGNPLCQTDPIPDNETISDVIDFDESFEEEEELLKEGDILSLKKIIAEEIEISRLVLPSSQDSALHIACTFSSRWMLNNGFEIFLEHQNFDGKRPLHEAAIIGDLSIVDILIQKVLHILQLTYIVAGAEIDPLKRADWTPLMLASAKGHLSVIKKLISKNASCDLINKDGWTPFHLACRDADAEVVEFFLSLKTDIWKTRSKNGRTPLHTAALHGNIDIVSSLLSKTDLYIDDSDSCGNTVLMDAVRSGKFDCVALLLKRNPHTLMKQDKLGRLPIHMVAEAGHNNILSFLIKEYQLDVNSRTQQGETPLHFAVKENHIETAKLLLSLGVGVNHQDKNGRTALWISASSKNLESYNLLLANGAEDIVDQYGKKPSDFIWLVNDFLLFPNKLTLQIQNDAALKDTKQCKIFRLESSFFTRTTGEAEDKLCSGRVDKRLESLST